MISPAASSFPGSRLAHVCIVSQDRVSTDPAVPAALGPVQDAAMATDSFDSIVMLDEQQTEEGRQAGIRWQRSVECHREASASQACFAGMAWSKGTSKAMRQASPARWVLPRKWHSMMGVARSAAAVLYCTENISCGAADLVPAGMALQAAAGAAARIRRG